MRANLIPLASHTHNADPTARLEWSDRDCSKSVYSVRGGFVACWSEGVELGALPGLFPSMEAARAALEA